jgi:transposase
MDKGFYSLNNVKTLLEKEFSKKFLIAVPFTLSKTKKLIAELKNIIDKAAYTIPLSRTESIQGMCREIEWDDNKKVYTHIFFNMVKSIEEKKSLYTYVSTLAEKARNDPENSKLIAEYNKYLTIKKENDCKPIVTIKQDVLDEEVSHAGWMILISNQIKDVKKALSIYRAKDAVEKGFYRLKNSLDLNRLRVHSDDAHRTDVFDERVPLALNLRLAMQGKLFLGFISLILMSHIHHVMTSTKQYKFMSMKELTKEMEKLRIQYIAGNRILFPLTKSHKNIFKIFGLENPL